MRKQGKRFLTFVLYTAILNNLGCTTTTQKASPPFEANQLVRYAVKTDFRIEYAAYYLKLSSGALTYDNQFRLPNDPAGPAVVDCSGIGRVGVSYLLKRKSNRSAQNLSIYAHWAHTAVNNGGIIQKQQHREHFAEGQDGSFRSASLALTEGLRVDGIISVRVFVGTDILLENSFRIIGCPSLASEQAAEKLPRPFLLCQISSAFDSYKNSPKAGGQLDNCR